MRITTRWTRTAGLMLALAMAAPGAIDAQDRGPDRHDDRFERIGERIERALRIAARETERALERAAFELERAEWNWEWDDDWDWDGAWDAGSDAGPRVRGDDFEWTGRLARGEVLEIKGISGRVNAVRASGGEVEVVARKSARRSDPESVRIDVIEHGGGATLCAVYPTPERADRANECAPGDGGRMNTNRNDTNVDWELRVPEGVRLVIRNVNGEIEAIDLDSDVEAYTVNGDVEVGTSGRARARTVNGSIRARFERLTEDVEFETVNGSVELDLSDDVDADLDAEWLNGSLDSELPLTLRGRMGRRSARGSFGDGGPLLRVRTVNGSIEIR